MYAIFGYRKPVTCAVIISVQTVIISVRTVIISVGEYSCNSQTSVGSFPTLLVAFLCNRLTVETKSLAKRRETQPSLMT